MKFGSLSTKVLYFLVLKKNTCCEVVSFKFFLGGGSRGEKPSLNAFTN